jgi:hypothetical protein
MGFRLIPTVVYRLLYYGVGHPESVYRARRLWEELLRVRPPEGCCFELLFIGGTGSGSLKSQDGWMMASPPVSVGNDARGLGLWAQELLSRYDPSRSLLVTDSFPNGLDNELSLGTPLMGRTVWLATHLSAAWSTHLSLRPEAVLSGDSVREILWCEQGPPPTWLANMVVDRASEIQRCGALEDYDTTKLLPRAEARRFLGLKDGDFAVGCVSHVSIEHRRRLSGVVQQMGEAWRSDVGLPSEQFRLFWHSHGEAGPEETNCLRGYDLFLGHFDYRYSYRIGTLLTPRIAFLEANDPYGSRERLVSMGYLKRPLQRLSATELSTVKAFREILSSTRATRHAGVAGTLGSPASLANSQSSPVSRVAGILLDRLVNAPLQ